jgi:hypothetical protein
MLSQLFIPLGVIFAAFITAIASFIALVISKEQKTSEFRQVWIDGLRNELAEFGSHARRIAAKPNPIFFKALTAKNALDSIEAINEERLWTDPLEESRQRLAQMYYTVQLRLNLVEDDHSKLIEHMDNVYEILNQKQDDFEATVEELQKLAEVARNVLKREWMRVKVGESAFRKSIVIAKWGLGISASVFITGILYMILKNF